MKVVVTGANGFVGQALCRQLIAVGYDVTAMTRQPWSILGLANNWVLPEYANAPLVEGLSGHDVLVHLAAKTHKATKSTKENLRLYREANLEPSMALASAAKAAGVKRFIYLSSIKVNGEQTYGRAFSANDEPKPEDAYGMSKWETEIALRNELQNSSTHLVVIRAPLIWGGDAVKGNLAILRKWVAWGLPLPLKNWHNKRDLVSLTNLCDFLSLCLVHPQVIGQTLLVSDGEVRSSLEVAAIASQNSLRSFALPQFVYHYLARHFWFRKLYGNLELDISHSLQLTGWKPTKTY